MQAAKLPPMLIVHGTDDETVPFTNSLCFHDVLRSRGAGPVRSLWARGRNHQDPVTAFMLEDGSEVEKAVTEFVHQQGGRGLVARL